MIYNNRKEALCLVHAAADEHRDPPGGLKRILADLGAHSKGLQRAQGLQFDGPDTSSEALERPFKGPLKADPSLRLSRTHRRSGQT